MGEVALGLFFGKSSVHLDPIWNIREKGWVEARFKEFQIGRIREAGGAVRMLANQNVSI